MALDWQALAAKKAWKAFETCEALEQVAARMKRVMGLTPELSRASKRRRLERIVRLCLHLLIWLRLGCAANQ